MGRSRERGRSEEWEEAGRAGGGGKVEKGRGGGLRVGRRERMRSESGKKGEGGGVEVDVSTHAQDYTWVTFSLCELLSMSSVGKNSKERCLGGVVGASTFTV